LAVDSFIGTEALAWIYLLPVIVMAMHYGSTVGVLTSFASALAAAYFCFPPKFSFFISDPLNVAELGFFLLLTVIASKAVAVVTRDERVTRRPKWPVIGWWRRRQKSARPSRFHAICRLRALGGVCASALAAVGSLEARAMLSRWLIAGWLSGYSHAKSNNLIIALESVEENVNKLTNYCYDEKNFKVPIMEAIVRVLGK